MAHCMLGHCRCVHMHRRAGAAAHWPTPAGVCALQHTLTHAHPTGRAGRGALGAANVQLPERCCARCRRGVSRWTQWTGWSATAAQTYGITSGTAPARRLAGTPTRLGRSTSTSGASPPPSGRPAIVRKLPSVPPSMGSESPPQAPPAWTSACAAHPACLPIVCSRC